MKTVKVGLKLKKQAEFLSLLKAELSIVFEMLKQEEWNELLIVEKFNNLLDKYPGNQIVIKHFLDFLKLSNNPTVFNTFEFQDLTVLHELMSQLNPWDIDSESEYYFYLDVILSKPKKAKKVLKALKKRIRQKQKEWKN